jgi:hypothetical protein
MHTGGKGREGEGRRKVGPSHEKSLVNKNAINVIKPKSCVLSSQFSQPEGPYQNIFDFWQKTYRPSP